jgi:ketosteroid isomerase-like protein
MKKNIVLNLVDAINKANVDDILKILTEDHVFIDSQDHRTTGKNVLREAWSGYFALFPDYKIEINEFLEKGPLICMFGYASGTYKNLHNEKNSNYWRIPAAWTAVIMDNKIKQWQVYADNLIVMDIINRNR